MQLVLLLLALVSVPWMLIPKPILLKKQHEQVCLYSIPHSFAAFWLQFIYTDCFFSIRGIKATNTQCSRAPMNQWEQSWGNIMMNHMTTRSLSLVKFLFTNLSTPSNLFLVQSQIQLHTFVFGLWGNTTLSKCLQTWPHLLSIPYLHHYSHGLNKQLILSLQSCTLGVVHCILW